MRRENIATVLGGVIAAAAIFSLSTQSCGILDNGGIGGLDAGVASLRIVAPTDGQCVVAQAGDIPYVPISLEIENLQLQPPGVCSQELTTVSSTGTGFGGAGGTGGSSLALPCGHLVVFVCSQASVVTDGGSLFSRDDDVHCPLGAPPNNEGSGTEIDMLLPDLRDTNDLHVDVFLAREARFLGDLVDAGLPFPPRGLNLTVKKPGGVCPAGTTSASGGMGGASGAGGKGGSGGV